MLTHKTQNEMRYVTPFVPGLYVLSAMMLADVWRRVQELSTTSLIRRWIVVSVSALAGVIVVYLAQGRENQRFPLG
jgi:hypothetical protein